MERIADAAGVSRRTIYQIFGSRVGLFAAIEQDLFRRGQFVEIQEAFNKNSDARQILEEALPASVRLMQREEAILRALFQQSLIDPEAATLTRRIEEGRIGGVRYLAQLLVKQGYVRPDLTEAEVGDVLALLTDFVTYDQWKTRVGLSPEEVLRRLKILAASILKSS